MNVHTDCGKGDDSGPFEPDCTCRDTVLEDTCALNGCGFCRRVFEAHRDSPVLVSMWLLVPGSVAPSVHALRAYSWAGQNMLSESGDALVFFTEPRS